MNLAILGVAENVIGLGNGLEFLFCALITGVYIGVILAREFAESLADLICRSRLLYSEQAVIVFGLSRHGLRERNFRQSFSPSLPRPSRHTPGFPNRSPSSPFAVHRGQRLDGYVLHAESGADRGPFVPVLRQRLAPGCSRMIYALHCVSPKHTIRLMLCDFPGQAESLVRRRVHVDRDAAHPRCRGRKDTPASFILYKS